eukprot:scaffold3046_cov71-Cyclotella_meneghiniana.AAC.6
MSFIEKTERGTRLSACECLLILTVSRLPAYDCSHSREMRRLPACRLRLSRRLASPARIVAVFSRSSRLAFSFWMVCPIFDACLSCVRDGFSFD